MIEVQQTKTSQAGCTSWPTARRARVRRLTLGNPGDVKPVGEGVSEMRIDYGPGYRVYFAQRGKEFVLLLAGGDKRTQAQDIKAAIVMARKRKGSP